MSPQNSSIIPLPVSQPMFCAPPLIGATLSKPAMHLWACCRNQHKGGGCQLLIVTVLQNVVVLISCIDFYVIHLLAGSPEQESIRHRNLLLLKANLVLMMHEEIFKH